MHREQLTWTPQVCPVPQAYHECTFLFFLFAHQLPFSRSSLWYFYKVNNCKVQKANDRSTQVGNHGQTEISICWTEKPILFNHHYITTPFRYTLQSWMCFLVTPLSLAKAKKKRLLFPWAIATYQVLWRVLSHTLSHLILKKKPMRKYKVSILHILNTKKPRALSLLLYRH